ncbi:MAG: KilA-N domain-containing protein [Saprospiraceae bacterium]|nr:KilA-N domain-containing protein [Saprospiraceae bacterium]
MYQGLHHGKNKINVQGTEIKLKRHNEQDYFSLTDIARHADQRTDSIIQGYLRNGANLDFLATWEGLHNDHFNSMNFNGIRQRAGGGAFVLSVNEWVEKTGAVGIFSNAGRYGGTYGHKDIALQFATWISPSFYLYLIREFDRLKTVEAEALGLSWNLRREISKANYVIHTDAVRTNIVPVLDWNTKREGLYFASEADLLNLAVFGTTAKQWKVANPEAKGNLRDGASHSRASSIGHHGEHQRHAHRTGLHEGGAPGHPGPPFGAGTHRAGGGEGARRGKKP